MFKIHNFLIPGAALVLMLLHPWSSPARAQDNEISEADEAIVIKVQKSGRANDSYSDEFVASAIEVTERQSRSNLLLPLSNLAATSKISPSSKKRIEGFLHQQIGSSNSSMRWQAVYAASFLSKEQSVPWLLKAVDDDNQDVRIAALSQLRLYASPSDIRIIDEALDKRRAAPGIEANDITVVFGKKVVKILRDLEGGFADPSRFDDATLIDVVLPRALRQNDHYSDALVLRVISTLKKMNGMAAQNLLAVLSRMAAGEKISAASRERIAKAIAEEGYRENVNRPID